LENFVSETMTPDNSGSAISLADAVQLLEEREPDQADETEAEGVKPEAENDTAEPEADATEDEAEDAESEDDAEDDAEDDDPDEKSVQDHVVIDGDQMTFAEIRQLKARGQNFEAEYTRKFQQIGQERRAVVEEGNKRIAQLERTLAELHTELPTEPDWVRLAEEDPLDYPVVRAEWDQKVKVRQHAFNEVQQSKAQAQIQAQEATVADLHSGSFEPSWADKEKLATGLNQITEYAVSEGYDPEDLKTVADARIIKTLEKARRYDELQGKAKSAPAKVRDKPKVVKSSSKKTATQRKGSARKAAMEQLNKSGSIHDAVAYLESG
tara:strand:- start:412 stop:1383 length:972 start_codon:yes stop_codon:yes gene_type:complete